MRKLVFIFFILPFLIEAQVTGTQFTPDRTYYKNRWCIQIAFATFNCGYPNYYVKGDSAFSGKYYQKVFSQNKSTFDTLCIGYYTLMHYDNKKLYLNNKLTYNFNLVPGDTFSIAFGNTMNHPSGMYTYTVTVSDSVFIGTKWRNRLTLTKPPVTGLPQVKWVDGIGDINYGFNCDYTTVELAISTGGSASISCFSEYFQNTYGTACGIGPNCTTTGIKEKNLNSILNVYPNPVTSILNISTDQDSSHSVEIINYSGQTVLKIPYSNTIDVSKFANGIYTLKITTKENQNLYSKFVKE